MWFDAAARGSPSYCASGSAAPDLPLHRAGASDLLSLLLTVECIQVTRVIPVHDYTVSRAPRQQVPSVLQGTHGGAGKRDEWDKVKANSSRVVGGGAYLWTDRH